MTITQKIKQFLKQYFCDHYHSKNEVWLIRNGILQKASCLDCGKTVPVSLTLNNQYKISLLEEARSLKENEKIRIY